MENLNRIMGRHRSGQTAAPVVWHYTNRRGLEGILESHTVRASDATTMNDPNELMTGHRALEQALVRARLQPEVAQGVREHLSRSRAVMDQGQTFVLSASNRDDSLAQWRAYGGLKADLTGYAIGFKVEELNLLEHRPFVPNATLGEGRDNHQHVSVWRDVIYDERAQSNEADEFIDLLARLDDPAGYDPAERDYMHNQVIVKAYAPPAYAGVVTRLKADHWDSEDEVRITATVIDADRFHVVPVNGRTYVELTGWRSLGQIIGTSTYTSAIPAPLPVVAVRAGPKCPRDDLRDVLDVHGYTDAQALASEISCR